MSRFARPAIMGSWLRVRSAEGQPWMITAAVMVGIAIPALVYALTRVRRRPVD